MMAVLFRILVCVGAIRRVAHEPGIWNELGLMGLDESVGAYGIRPLDSSIPHSW